MANIPPVTIRKKLVVLTGAGNQCRKWYKTFRDSDGLWEGHNVQDVAHKKDGTKIKLWFLIFYNQRRKQLKEVQPI
jgi:NAD-dependent deacetylase